MKLYEIRQDMQDLLNKMGDDNFDGARLSQLEIEFHEKLGNCAAVLKNMKASIKAYAEEIKRLQDSKKAVANAYESLSNYVKREMELAEVSKSEHGVHKIVVREASKPSVVILDEDVISNDWKVIQRKVDKESIFKNFTETGEIPFGVDIRKTTHIVVS